MTDKDGKPHGDKNAATIKREHVVKLMASRAEQPESANGLRKALRAMMPHAVEIGLRADDPARDVRAITPASDVLTWSGWVVSISEPGCTECEIAAITGHASLREVACYTKAADQPLALQRWRWRR